MKAIVTYFPKQLHNPKVAQLVGDNIATKPCPWKSDLSNQCQQVLAENGGFDIRITFDFSPKQYRKYSHFRLRPKHIIYETDAVFNRNLDSFEAAPIHHEDDFGRYKIVDKVFVHQIKPKFDRVWALEQFEFYFVEKEILKTMLQRFSGFYEIPVVHHKTNEVIEAWGAFMSDSWLPSFDTNKTTEIISMDFGKQSLRSMGLQAADPEDLQGLFDICRTPSATHCGDSGYIISRNVWEFWVNMGIKSFHLEPVLSVGSQEYDDYLTLWQQVQDVISLNPGNNIRTY